MRKKLLLMIFGSMVFSGCTKVWICPQLPGMSAESAREIRALNNTEINNFLVEYKRIKINCEE